LLGFRVVSERVAALVGGLVLSVYLMGCTSSPSRISVITPVKDGFGERRLVAEQVPDSVELPELPVADEKRKSTSYVVRGERYYPIPSEVGYKKQGTASWYGSKFHGNPTANGERFDMYTLSAAHKTLPLPSFVKVTNRKNGRSVIVRVNDRGPFVGERLIDLSYAAAVKIDMINEGVADVLIEAIIPESATTSRNQAQRQSQKKQLLVITANKEKHSAAGASRMALGKVVPKSTPSLTASAKTTFIQVGAFSDWSNAELMRQRIEGLNIATADIHASQADAPTTMVYKVNIGPLAQNGEVEQVGKLLRQANISFVRSSR